MYRNLKRAMSEKKITMEGMARILGVHRNTIQNKLDGESEFSINQAFEIARVIFPEYKLSYLFERMGEERDAS